DKATSGDAGGDTGVAGSFALNVSSATSEGVIEGTATVNAGSGPVTLGAANTTESTVEAKASAASGKTGVGISIAINVASNTTNAGLADGAILTGGSDLTLSATGSHTATTSTNSGGAAKNGTGVGGALSIPVSDNESTARHLTGAVSVTATHHGASTTTADGTALGSDAAVGAAITLAFVDDSATATTARNITADGAVSFTANADGASSASSKASAAGA